MSKEEIQYVQEKEGRRLERAERSKFIEVIGLSPSNLMCPHNWQVTSLGYQRGELQVFPLGPLCPSIMHHSIPVCLMTTFARSDVLIYLLGSLWTLKVSSVNPPEGGDRDVGGKEIVCVVERDMTTNTLSYIITCNGFLKYFDDWPLGKKTKPREIIWDLLRHMLNGLEASVRSGGCRHGKQTQNRVCYTTTFFASINQMNLHK